MKNAYSNAGFGATPSKREQRRSPRDDVRDTAITCFVRTPSGETLEGVARDVSDGGARISGPIGLLKEDDEVELTLVLLGQQKVRYRARIRHVEPLIKTYGVAFLSEPEAIESSDGGTMQCRACRKHFETDFRFCPYCGERLKRA